MGIYFIGIHMYHKSLTDSQSCACCCGERKEVAGQPGGSINLLVGELVYVCGEWENLQQFAKSQVRFTVLESLNHLIN